MNIETAAYNSATVIGELMGIDERSGSGAAMLFIRGGDRAEKQISGQNDYIPAWFTPVIAVHVPKHVASNLKEKQPDLLKIGAHIVCEAKIRGIRRNIEGQDFFSVELEATFVRKMTQRRFEIGAQGQNKLQAENTGNEDHNDDADS